jgi:hypothetical protein
VFKVPWTGATQGAIYLSSDQPRNQGCYSGTCSVITANLSQSQESMSSVEQSLGNFMFTEFSHETNEFGHNSMIMQHMCATSVHDDNVLSHEDLDLIVDIL